MHFQFPQRVLHCWLWDQFRPLWRSPLGHLTRTSSRQLSWGVLVISGVAVPNGHGPRHGQYPSGIRPTCHSSAWNREGPRKPETHWPSVKVFFFRPVFPPRKWNHGDVQRCGKAWTSPWICATRSCLGVFKPPWAGAEVVCLWKNWVVKRCFKIILAERILHAANCMETSTTSSTQSRLCFS